MENQFVINVDCLKDENGLLTVYNEELGLANLDKSVILCKKSRFVGNDDQSLEKIVFLWVVSGNCLLNYENTTCELGKHDLLIKIHSESLNIDLMSDDFKAKIIVVEKDFVDECIPNKSIGYFFYYLFVKQQLQIKISEEQLLIQNVNYDNLKKRLRDVTNAFYDDLIKMALISFILETSNILIGKKDKDVFRFYTRKEEIVARFVNLLRLHHAEHHDVTFYADKLFISPQYLTMILKKLTGKTTNKWIDDVLLSAAKKMLKTTSISIQQVADQLNFSDQSTFGKFFKKYTGKTPAEYRKLNRLSLAVA